MTLLRHGLRSAGTFAGGFAVWANGDPPRAVPTPPLEGNFVRFVKTFVIPRLDRGNQVCTDKKAL